jgi:CoA:oxalate CoA-transferase
MSEGPLTGVTVVDLSHHIAGPYCTKLMAGMGAEVIKIERPGSGDPARSMGPFPDDVPDPEKSGTFLYLNTGKKGITLNLKTTTGVSILGRLVKKADVLVENFEPRVMPSLGLSYETLSQKNPGLVMTSISNFGQTGSYRDYKAEEITIMAMGGFVYLGGAPEREPLRLGFAASQYMGGLAGFSATMAALYHAEQTEVGQHVDVSLMECIVVSHFQAIEQYVHTGVVQTRNRTMFVFPCKDGVVQLGMQPHHWPKLTQLLGMPELTDDPRFSNTVARQQHAEELESFILPWMLERTMVEVYNTGQALGLPIGYAATSKDLYESAQYKARGFFIDTEHPQAGNLSYPGAPLRMGEFPWQNARASLLGEHNEEILCGRLGYTGEDLIKLRDRGVI